MNATEVEPLVARLSINAPVASQRYIYIAAMFAASGGLLFGYDIWVNSGALISFKQSFGLSLFQRRLIRTPGGESQ
jgi:hypothetical protein